MHLGGSQTSGRTAPDPAAAWAFRSGLFAACSSSTTEPTARSTANTAAARSQRAGGPATECHVQPSGGRGRGQRYGREHLLMTTFLQLPITAVIQLSDFVYSLFVRRCDSRLSQPRFLNLRQLHNDHRFSVLIRPLIPSETQASSPRDQKRGIYQICAAVWWRWLWVRMGQAFWIFSVETFFRCCHPVPE